jgi:nucleotide-binding universal stress UspA family protein
MEIRQILAPTDFSEFSIQAIESAFALAQTFGAKLLLLHVVELPAYPVEGFVPSTMGTTLIDDLQRQASLDLAQVLPEPPNATVEVSRQVVVGIPYRKIVEVAEAAKADLIVVATHGRTGLSHLVMGSVAERVVRTAPCPVLTIRPTAVTA